MKIQYLLTGFLLLGFTAPAIAQDTLKLSLIQAEQLFLKENRQLIAKQYETDQTKADLITAKLFDNPELTYENLFYNQETGRFLETSAASGQYSASISQLIRLAGKRNKHIQLASTGIKQAEYAYFDLMRSLRYQLHSTFYKIFYTRQSAGLYQQQVLSLQQLLIATETQFKLGNMALKDVIRIKSLLYKLQSEQASLLNEIEDQESTLRLLTHIKAGTALLLMVPDKDYQAPKIQQTALGQLLDAAIANRADLQLTRAQVNYAAQNLVLQKAMAVPDVELSLSYDLKGNYPEKYTGLGVKIPIPLFNRNQGEIKKAKIAIAAGSNELKQQEALLENEVYNSYHTALRTELLFQQMDADFSGDFEKLIAGVGRNFKNRTISLLEFLDFYDAYKENTLQLNQLRYERMASLEALNYVTGSVIFK